MVFWWATNAQMHVCPTQNHKTMQTDCETFSQDGESLRTVVGTLSQDGETLQTNCETFSQDGESLRTIGG